MDEAIRRAHEDLARALNRGADAAGRYEDDGVLAPPGHPGLIRGRDAIRNFLAVQGLAPIEFEILQAERSGTRGYAVASYRRVASSGTSFTVFAERAGAWRVVSDVYGAALLPHLLDEWKECRISIDRFDKLITDVRKYGFTLITGLLTASAFWSGTSSSGLSDPARVGAAFILMVLVFALFTVDRSLVVFLRSAVTRARHLEPPLGAHLTGLIGDVAEHSHIATWAAWLYTLFMVGATVPVFAAGRGWAVAAGIVLDLAFIVAIWVYHAWTKAGLERARGAHFLGGA